MEKKYFKKIIAQNSKDLEVISALSSGSKVKIGDIKYLKKNKIFIISINRKEKEVNNEIINSIIKFSFIDSCKSKKIDQRTPDKIIELITINILKKNNNYQILFLFSKNSYISLKSEIIDVELIDQQNKIE